MAKRPQNREERKQRDEAAERKRRNEKLLNAQLREADKVMQSIIDKEDISLENYADKLQLSARLNENAKIQATIAARIEDLTNSAVKNADLLVEEYGIMGDFVSRVQSKFAEVVINSENIASSAFEIVDISAELAELADKEFELDEKRGELGKKEYERLKSYLELAKERLTLIEKQNESQEIANKLAKNYLTNSTLVGASTKGLLHSLEDIKSSVGTGGLGIVGEVLGVKAGKYIEGIEEDIHKKIVKAFQESGTSAISAFSVAKMAFGSFIKFALPALGILGLLGAIGFLIHSFKHLDEEASELGKHLGLSRKEALAAHVTAKGLAKEMKIVNINAKEAGEAIGATIGIVSGLNLGLRIAEGNEAVKQMVKDVAVLQTSFGLAADEAGGISGISEFATIMGKSMGQVVKESLKLGKGLLTTKAALTVVGKIAPGIAIAFKKGSVELLKAAQRAKLLGIELDDVADFGDKILEIESSLESEMSARVITGKQLNFDLARQYALQGNVAALQEEMLTQIGSMSEYQSMNRLQQKYLAEAFGMTVDEVAKLLTAQERLVELGVDQAKMDDIQAMNAADLAEEMKNTNNEKLKGYLQTLAKEKESASINERISDAMTKIKEKLAGTLIPLVEMAHEFLNSAKGGEFLNSVVKGIETTLKALVPVIKFLAENMWVLAGALGVFAGAKLIKGAGTIISLFKGIGGAATAAAPAVDAVSGAFGDVAAQMDATADASSALGQSMGSAGGAASGINGVTSTLSSSVANMAVVAVGLIAFAGALYITAKAFQEFSKVDVKGIIAGTVAMGGLLVMTKLLTAFAVGTVTTGAIVAIYALAAAMVAFGGSVYLMGKGAEAFSNSLMIMVDSMKKFATITNVTEIVDKIKEVVTSISNMGSTINPGNTTKVKKALKNLGIDQLVEFGKLADMDLGKAGQNVINAINSLASVSIEQKFDFGKKAKWASNGIKGFTKQVGTGIIGAFEQLNKALGELELDNLEALAKIAGTDMSKVGESIKNAIESLGKLQVEQSTIEGLKKTKDVLKQVKSALVDEGMLFNFADQNLLEPLELLSSFDMSKVKDATFMLKDVVYNLSQVGLMGGTNGLDLLSEKFTKLSNALDALNIEKLKELSNVNADNLGKIAAVFQQPVGVRGTTGGGTTGGGESEESKMNKKLDRMISVLENIFNTANQPVVIKIGDRTIETIGRRFENNKLFVLKTAGENS